MSTETVERENTAKRLLRRAIAEAGASVAEIGRALGLDARAAQKCVTLDDEHGFRVRDLSMLVTLIGTRWLDEMLAPLGYRLAPIKDEPPTDVEIVAVSAETLRDASDAVGVLLDAHRDGTVTRAEAEKVHAACEHLIQTVTLADACTTARAIR